MNWVWRACLWPQYLRDRGSQYLRRMKSEEFETILDSLDKFKATLGYKIPTLKIKRKKRKYGIYLFRTAIQTLGWLQKQPFTRAN